METSRVEAILAYQRALAEQAVQLRLQAKQQYDEYLRMFKDHLVAQTEAVLNQLSHTWPALAESPEWPTAAESTRRELFREHMRDHVDQNSAVWEMLQVDGFNLLQRTYEQDTSARTDISGTVNALADRTNDFQMASAELMHRMQLMQQYISIADDQPENFEQHFLGNAELLNRLAADGIVLQKPDFRPRPEVSYEYENLAREAGKQLDQRETRRRRTGRDEKTEEFESRRQGLAKAQRTSEAQQRRDADMAEIERLRKQDRRLARQTQSPTAKELEKKLRRKKP